MAVKSLVRSGVDNFEKYSSLLAGNIGYDTYFEHITTTTLGSAVASVTFSDLDEFAGTYQHLQIRMVARGNRSAAGNSPLFIQFNSSGGTAYASHGLSGSGSSVSSEAVTSAAQMERAGNIAGSNAGANVFGANIIDILDPYETTKNTTVRVLGGGAYGANPIIGLFSGFWNNTASITSIKLSDYSGTDFQQYCRFSLYGLR